MLPSLFDNGIISIIRLFGHTGPADQDTASLLVGEGLRGIEVKAVIQLPEVCGMADIILLVLQSKIVTDEITGLIQILVPLLLRLQTLGAA